MTNVLANRDLIREVAHRHRATTIAVFGSVARGDDGPGSDANFLVDLDVRRRVDRLPVRPGQNSRSTGIAVAIWASITEAVADHDAMGEMRARKGEAPRTRHPVTGPSAGVLR